MRLQSERLTVRPAIIYDLKQFHAIRNSEAFLKYNPIPVSTVEETKHELEQLISKEWMYAVTLRGSDEMIGIIDVTPDYLRYGVTSANISYSMHEQFAGHGYMTEALQLMIQYIFQEMNKEVIAVRVFKGNEASASLIDKLGFTHEGTLRKCVKGNDDIIYDDLLFSLLREKWTKI